MPKISNKIESKPEYIPTLGEIKEFEKMLDSYVGPWRFELFMCAKGYYLDAEIKQVTIGEQIFTKVSNYRVKGEKQLDSDNREHWVAGDAIVTAEKLWQALIQLKSKKAYAQKKEKESLEELEEPTRIIINAHSVFDDPEDIKLEELPF